jgi:hypothetical protein
MDLEMSEQLFVQGSIKGVDFSVKALSDLMSEEFLSV